MTTAGVGRLDDDAAGKLDDATVGRPDDVTVEEGALCENSTPELRPMVM